MAQPERAQPVAPPQQILQRGGPLHDLLLYFLRILYGLLGGTGDPAAHADRIIDEIKNPKKPDA